MLAALGLAALQTRTAADSMPAAAVSGQPQAVVQCAPGQQAVVSQALVNGQMVTRADCAWMQNGQAGFVPASLPAAPAQDIVEYRPAPRAVQYVERRPAPTRVVRSEPKRSWQKSALIIGGSAGAGAGIGALTGGKKGALIGAAIGGGAGTIFEAFKRR